MAHYLGTGYLRDAFDSTAELKNNARRVLKGVKYDTMVGTGLSGSLVIPVLARALKKNWAIVRKDNDGSHSSCVIEGTLGERWIFVDDFVSSGSTRKRVIQVVTRTAKEYGIATEHVGSYLYHSMDERFVRPEHYRCY
jgi:orotate phosphoribosyltransferase